MLFLFNAACAEETWPGDDDSDRAQTDRSNLSIDSPEGVGEAPPEWVVVPLDDCAIPEDGEGTGAIAAEAGGPCTPGLCAVREDICEAKCSDCPYCGVRDFNCEPSPSGDRCVVSCQCNGPAVCGCPL
jgi:hypothetical protein